ncbi:MAG TPA: VWA domain-containing protein [Candidatus Methanoperedens sp.]|nr:VWA domain-containing protein [Candidatus Methanoperedens sp.]
MKPTPEELKSLLAARPAPEPSAEGRARALQAALAEQRRAAAREARIKGSAVTGRHTGTPDTGGPVMRKLGYALGGLALAGIAAAIIVPNFLQFRMKAKSSVQQWPSESYEALPAGRAPMAPAPMAPLVSAPAQAPGWRADRALRLPPPSQQYVGRDRFEKIVENPVKVAAEEPVSTFSIDVDTASYAFVRRALNEGHLPQKDAVRIEELVNYFDYDYPAPTDREAPFRASVAVFPTPWNAETKLALLALRGLEVRPERRPRANLVFLVDVSGSMASADKLPLLKSAFRLLVENLAAEDSVAIVVYAGAAGTVLEPTPARQRARILAAIDRLEAGGSTAGAAGITQAYALAEANFDPGGVNRVILATDGDFNVGITNPEELKGFVERKRASGVYLTVLGFGQGNLNDALMQKLAQNGNGTAVYIDTLSEARKVLVEEAGSTLVPIAQDVKIQVEFNPAQVAEYRLIGYETRLLRREDFHDDRVDAGDVGAGHRVTALYEIAPAGGRGRRIDDLRYGGRAPDAPAWTRGDGTAAEYAFLKIRYKLPGEERSRLIETPISPAQEYRTLAEVPAEARFAAAVAAFGQILRGDARVGSFTYEDVLALAGSARGEDAYGYRAEFLNLVRLAGSARPLGER